MVMQVLFRCFIRQSCVSPPCQDSSCFFFFLFSAQICLVYLVAVCLVGAYLGDHYRFTPPPLPSRPISSPGRRSSFSVLHANHCGDDRAIFRSLAHQQARAQHKHVAQRRHDTHGPQRLRFDSIYVCSSVVVYSLSPDLFLFLAGAVAGVRGCREMQSFGRCTRGCGKR